MTLSILSILPFFLIMALLALTSTWLLRLRFFSEVANSFSGGRYETLDGLRGYLALTVFFHHAVARYVYRRSGIWEYPDSALYGAGPQIAVATFFMITGFLFWSKAIRSGGRMDWRALYLSRFRRLVPLYVVAICALLVSVGFATGWSLHVGMRDLFVEIVRWFCFNFAGMPDINGLANTYTIEGVIWSLRYEWMFILVLPFAARLFRPTVFIPLALACCVYWAVTADRLIYSNFLFGMLAAYSVSQPRIADFIRARMGLAGNLALVAAFLLPEPFGDSLLRPILLFVFFVSVVNGNSMLGLLRLRGSKYLGAVSYSIYLLHGIVLFWAFELLRALGFAETPASFWTLVTLAGMATIVISGVTFEQVERRFIR